MDDSSKMLVQSEQSTIKSQNQRKSFREDNWLDHTGIDECDYGMEEEYRMQHGFYSLPKFQNRKSPSCLRLSTSGRTLTPRIRNRTVLKNGAINFYQEKIKKRGRRYLMDTLTTIVDMKWRYNLLIFTLGFVLCWVFFALLWYLMAIWYGDISTESPQDQCIVGVDSFMAAFYFSFETQATLGFGGRYPTDDCVIGVILLCFQAIVGALIQGFVVGFVFAKLSRPNKRSETILFSRNGVISLRDGRLCLFFRVGDIRDRSFIVNATISAIFISDKITKEGEVLQYYNERLKVRFDGCGNEIFLSWPAIIVHDIDESSPFYWMNSEQMARNPFELILLLRGAVESTGQTLEARTSYLPNEIIWGRKFCQVLQYRMDTGQYLVDYSKFDSTFESSTPNISAKALHQSHHHRQSCSSMRFPFTDSYRNSQEDENNHSNDDVFL